MTISWRTSSDPVHVRYNLEEKNIGVTIKSYWLYTREQQFTRGGTVGVWKNTLSQWPEPTLRLHPDYFRPGGADDEDNWMLIASFEKPGVQTTIVRIYVQGIETSAVSPAPAQEYAGKRTLTPLNSGPDYLATRSDDDYIMNSSQFGEGWIGIKGGVHDQNGWVENDLIQPSCEPKVPFSESQPGPGSNLARNIIVTTDSAYLHAQSSSYLDVVQTGNANEVLLWDIPSVARLQSENTDIPTLASSRYSPQYSGGNYVLYALTKQDEGDPLPDTYELGMRDFFSNQLITNGTASVLASVVIKGKLFRLWRREAALDDPAGTFVGINMLVTTNFTTTFPYELDVTDQGISFDPWAVTATPPPYTITSNNGRAVKGGILHS